MPLPDIDALTTLGGTLQNYSAVVDPTTDLDAAADNKSRCNVAMSTHTIIRGWCRVRMTGTTPSIVAHDALWGSLPAVIPTPARTTTGTITLTYPTSVNDEIVPPNAHALNIRAAWGQVRSAAAGFDVQVLPTSANVVTVYIRDNTNALSDTSSNDFDVFFL